MPWVKGQSGNPLGQASNGSIWRRAIVRALEKAEEDGKRPSLDDLAHKLIAQAHEGDMSALKEVGDRLDGKPAQVIAGDPENPLNIIGKLTWAKPE